MQKITRWLDQLGLVQYAEAFEHDAVDPELLRDLTETDLERLGVHVLGHRDSARDDQG
jgi:hypothetical protein